MDRSTTVMIASLALPEPLGFLLYPKSYKVARGGRGSSKSCFFCTGYTHIRPETNLRILVFRDSEVDLDRHLQALGSETCFGIDINYVRV